MGVLRGVPGDVLYFRHDPFPYCGRINLVSSWYLGLINLHTIAALYQLVDSLAWGAQSAHVDISISNLMEPLLRLLMVPFYYWELRALDQQSPTFWGQEAKILLVGSGRASKKSHSYFHLWISRLMREGYERNSPILVADIEHIKLPEDISPFAQDTDNQLVA